jgi:O-antigen/teichoic acid export membrane protein
VLLMTAMSLSVPQMVASSVFTMTGLHRLTAWAALAGMAVNLGLSLALIKYMGLVGVALATLVAASLVDVFVVFGLARRFYGIRYGESLLRVFVPVLIPGAIALGILMLLKTWMPPAGIAGVVGLAVIGFGVHTVLFLLVGLDRDERTRLKGLFKRGPRQPIGSGD